MKSIKLVLLFLFGLLSVSFAQQKNAQKLVFKTPTVQCEMCKKKIEKYLGIEPGVSSVKVDYEKKTTTVTYFADKNNAAQLKAAIANAGYDADDIIATEAAYNKLPACCKKPSGTINTNNKEPQ